MCPGDGAGIEPLKRLGDKTDMHRGKRIWRHECSHFLSRSRAEIAFLKSVQAGGGLGHAFKAVEKVQGAGLAAFGNDHRLKQGCAAAKNPTFHGDTLQIHGLPKCLGQDIAAVPADQCVVAGGLIKPLEFGKAFPGGKQGLIKPNVRHVHTMRPQPGSGPKIAKPNKNTPDQLMGRLKFKRQKTSDQALDRLVLLWIFCILYHQNFPLLASRIMESIESVMA